VIALARPDDTPHPNPSPEGEGLSLRDEARRLNTPPLQGRGRGWGLSAATIDELQTRARAMRRNPTEPEKRLWRHLSNGQLEGYKFRRQQVIGRFIADFVCASAKLIVEVDGDTHSPDGDRLRDAALAAMGYRVIHVTNADVMRNIDGALWCISQALHQVDTPHPNPSPEGEGLVLRDDSGASPAAPARVRGETHFTLPLPPLRRG
jgi:very-short-patch-repair endonuclease